MLQDPPVSNIEINTMENSFMIKSGDITETILSDDQNDIQTSSIRPKSPDQNLEGTNSLSESPLIAEINSTPTVISTQITQSNENSYDCNIVMESPVQTVFSIKQCQDDDEPHMLMDTTMPIEQTNTSVTENLLINNSPTAATVLLTPTTPSVPKERKRRIIIDDDDESPTFNPLRSNKKLRGKNRRNKHNSMLKKQKKTQLLSTPSSSFIDKTNETAVFTSPEVVVSILN